MKARTPAPTLQRRTPQLVVTIAMAMLLSALPFRSAWAQLAPPPSVGAAQSFAVKGGTSVTAASLGPVETVINGDVGVSTGTSITGFPPATTTPPFVVHLPNDPATILANASILSLYNDLAARSGATPIGTVLGGQSLGPGIYSIGPGVGLLAANTNLTLIGAGTYIFQVANALTADVGSTVTLIGVDPCRVFWQVPTQATLNGINFVGNVVANAAIVLGDSATLEGRALTSVSGAVSMAGHNVVGGCSGAAPPSLLLAKQALTASFQNAGDVLSYSYVVTNSGTSTITGLVSIIDNLANVTCPVVGSLAPGDAIICSGTYTVTAADVTAGFVTNLATAYQGTTVSNEATATVLKIPAPPNPAPAAIRIVKRTNGTDNSAPTGPLVSVGSTVNWTYIVTNIGGVTLTNVTVTDDHGVVITCPAPGNGLVTLLAGQSITCTASGTVTAGQYTNFGTATGTPPTGPPVIGIDIDHYFGKPPKCPFSAPKITVFSVVNVPPVTVTLKVQAPGGLQSITVIALTNAIVVPSSLIFTPGTTAPVYVVVQKVNASQGSVIGLQANDNCNVTLFDPYFLTVNAGTREEVTGVLEDETLMQIVNHGLNSMRITVNGRQLPVVQLRRNETRTINIPKALMVTGDNTIILEARGPKGSSADVSGYPPPAASAQEEKARRERRETRRYPDLRKR